jgi:hypothetical protein
MYRIPELVPRTNVNYELGDYDFVYIEKKRQCSTTQSYTEILQYHMKKSESTLNFIEEIKYGT